MTAVAADRFRALYASEVIALLGYAARRVGRPEDAADIVADVFTVAWRRIDDVPSGPEARPWLFGVARNVVANHRRGAWRQDRLTDRLRGELRLISTPMGSPIADPGATVDDLHDVQKALDRLSPDDRELLLLTNWEGLSPTEVAAAMGIPAGTIRSRLHRARQQLRRELGPGHGTENGRADNDNDNDNKTFERYATSGHVQTGAHMLATDHEEPR